MKTLATLATKQILLILLLSLAIFFFSKISTADEFNENKEELLFAYEELLESWRSQKLTLSCRGSTFRIEKNIVGKKRLYKIQNSKWTEIKEPIFDGFNISWEEPAKKFELTEIYRNDTFCSSKPKGTYYGGENYELWQACVFWTNKRIWRDKFANIFIRNYAPNSKIGDFTKYFEITTSSKIKNSLRIDKALYSRRYEKASQKVSVTVLGNAPKRPSSPRRVTQDQYSFSPSGARGGGCAKIDGRLKK